MMLKSLRLSRPSCNRGVSARVTSSSMWAIESPMLARVKSVVRDGLETYVGGVERTDAGGGEREERSASFLLAGGRGQARMDGGSVQAVSVCGVCLCELWGWGMAVCQQDTWMEWGSSFKSGRGGKNAPAAAGTFTKGCPLEWRNQRGFLKARACASWRWSWCVHWRLDWAQKVSKEVYTQPPGWHSRMRKRSVSMHQAGQLVGFVCFNGCFLHGGGVVV